MLNKILTICLIILMLVFGYLWFIKTDLKTIVSSYNSLDNFLKLYGTWHIKNIEFRKLPVSELSKNIMNYSSLNNIKSEYEELRKKGDDIYHFYFIINLYKEKTDFGKIPYNTLNTDGTIVDNYISVLYEKDYAPVFQIIEENELHFLRAEAENHTDFSIYQHVYKEFILLKPNTDMNLTTFIKLSQEATGKHFIDYHASEFNCNQFSHCIVNHTKDLFELTYNITTSVRSKYNDYTIDYAYEKNVRKSFKHDNEMIHEFTDQKDNVFKSKILLNKHPFAVVIFNFITKLKRFKKMLKYLKK